MKKYQKVKKYLFEREDDIVRGNGTGRKFRTQLMKLGFEKLEKRDEVQQTRVGKKSKMFERLRK